MGVSRQGPRRPRLSLTGDPTIRHRGAGEQLAYDWAYWGRGDQQLPPGDWFIWLIMTGRGWGKTRTAVENISKMVRGDTPLIAPPGSPAVISIVADTAFDLRQYSVEGPSGFLNVGRPRSDRCIIQASRR